MKKTIVAIAGLIIVACNVVLADPPADQKWLSAVQKMVEQGQTKISTPSQDRVKLLQDWAPKHSYTITVTKEDTTYRLEIVKTAAKG